VDAPQSTGLAMRISFRPAQAEDFDYCANLYFAGMERAIRELNLDMAAPAKNFRERWESTQVRIITIDGAGIGWLQSTKQSDALFLAQLFVDASFRRQGIGTQVMHRIIGEAARVDAAVTLGVVKTNPAFRLYQRLGFQVTHEDDRKFYMRREPDIGAPMR
jgi:ribosomal protein S18 acetylase RimI-like enzyme